MKIKHVIVDGSNIATEGRDAPSLAQLDEAVQAFIEEYAPDFVTVVVDATFPNRIDRKERQTYEDAVNANELITPPAGAIGRGDAFILQIARRAGASILSNDSFQEFHGDYPWLFEKGRLIGGKPVPHVGWVFMDRAPVRGPTSRRAVSEARKVAKATDKTSTKAAKAATDTGDADGSAKAPRKRRSRAKAATAAPDTEIVETTAAADTSPASGDGRSGSPSRAPRSVDPYNEALPFIEFVAQHPVGSEVDATIERFSSHGAYVMVGAARAYLPLRNLADPAPRSAKEVLRVGDERRFVVVSIDPPRRGIDLAVPGVVDAPPVAPADMTEVAAAAADTEDEIAAPAKAAPKRTRTRKAAAPTVAADETASGSDEAEPSPRKATARKGRARKAAAAAPVVADEAARVGAVPGTEEARASSAPETAPSTEVARKAAGTRKVAGTKKAAKSPAKRAAAKKTPAGAAAAKATVKKAAATAAAKKAPARKAGAKKATTGTAKKATAAKTSPAKKATRRRAPADAGSEVVVPLPADDGGTADTSPSPAEATGG